MILVQQSTTALIDIPNLGRYLGFFAQIQIRIQMQKFFTLISVFMVLCCIGCEPSREDQAIRDAFFSFLRPNQADLNRRYGQCKFKKVTAYPSVYGPSRPCRVELGSGEASTIHSVVELSYVEFPMDPMDAQQFQSAHEHFQQSWPDIGFIVVRNNQYVCGLEPAQQINGIPSWKFKFLKEIKEKGTRPLLPSVMFPVVATKFGVPFIELANMEFVRFDYFGDSRLDRFEGFKELEVYANYKVSNGSVDGYWSFFFEDDGRCVAQRVRVDDGGGLMDVCEYSDDLTPRSYRRTTTHFETGEEMVLFNEFYFDYEPSAEVDLKKSRLPYYGLPEIPPLFQEPSSNWKYVLLILSLVGCAVGLVFFILRRRIDVG